MGLGRKGGCASHSTLSADPLLLNPATQTFLLNLCNRGTEPSHYPSPSLSLRMARMIRSKLLSQLFKTRPLCSGVQSTQPSKEPIITSGVSLNGHEPPSVLPKDRKARSILKFAVLGALTGATATTAYASYAYTLEEVDQKTVGFRESAKYNAGDDASALDKAQAFLHSAAMTVPAKAVDLYLDVRRLIEEQIKGYTDPSSEKLLPDLLPEEQHAFTLVLDLSETLVYSDWKRERGWRTFKRPGVDAFLEHLSQFYEIVVYSDQLDMYVNPIIERLDRKPPEPPCIRYRLSRAATRYVNGKHYRDLSKLNRDPSRVLYVSGHALETCLQPENCVPIKPWKLENDDTTLLDLIPFLEYVVRHRPADIRPVLSSYQGHDIPTEFLERTKEHQRRMQEQKQRGSFFWRR